MKQLLIFVALITLMSCEKQTPSEIYWKCVECDGTGFVEGREDEKDGPLTKWLMGLGLLTILYLIFC